MVRISRTSGRINIELVTIEMGNDLCVVITGGESPHLGAVAIAQARPSLLDHSKTSATTSTIVLLGHQEDELAKGVAGQLATQTGKNVVVCCGIHLEKITSSEIAAVEQLTQQLLEDLLKLLV